MHTFSFLAHPNHEEGFGNPSSFVCFLQLLRFCLYHAYIATAPSNIWMMNWEMLPSASIVWNASFRSGDPAQQFLWWLRSRATCIAKAGFQKSLQEEQQLLRTLRNASGWAVMDIHWSYGRWLIRCRWSAVRSALRSLRGSVPQWIRESHPKLGWWSQAAAELVTWFLDRIDSLVSQ